LTSPETQKTFSGWLEALARWKTARRLIDEAYAELIILEATKIGDNPLDKALAGIYLRDSVGIRFTLDLCCDYLDRIITQIELKIKAEADKKEALEP